MKNYKIYKYKLILRLQHSYICFFSTRQILNLSSNFHIEQQHKQNNILKFH
jgi:hypothetical protein